MSNIAARSVFILTATVYGGANSTPSVEITPFEESKYAEKVTAEDVSALIGAIFHDEKINAIKAIRRIVAGIGLMEAKALYETFVPLGTEVYLRPTRPDAPPKNRFGSGGW